MDFYTLSQFLKELEETPSRNKMTEILVSVFKKASETEIDKICYLLLGRIAPQYTGIEFNLAEKMMIRAISQTYGREVANVQETYKRLGDLGDTVAEIAKTEKLKDLKTKKPVVKEVFRRLYEIAQDSGKGSQERKLEAMATLLQNLDPLSCKYVVRIPLGKLRLGFSDVTMLDALSLMEVGDKSKRKEIEKAYNVTADIGKIAKFIKRYGLERLDTVKTELGIPIRPSLADRLPSAEKIIEKLGPQVAVEPKYDGLRLQLHLIGKKEVMLFSRNLENVTHMFPDIVSAALKLKVKNAIFDSEAIAFNSKTGKFFPFQETVQRKRKYAIPETVKKIPLKVFAFDVLHINGKSTLEEPFAQRRKILTRLLKGQKDKIILTNQEIVSKPEVLKKLAEKYIGEGLEGIVAKKLDIPYQAGARGFHWVKYKKHNAKGSKQKGLADTIDCLLMGAYLGKGKRTRFGYGGFLLCVLGRAQTYYTISNLGTGLTDEQFIQMSKTVTSLKAKEQPEHYNVDKLTRPDIWVKPEVVLEILSDEITVSPRHTAGYSLRFPRLIRVRSDKNPLQATTVSEIAKLYKMQTTAR